jgi:hypothetical protein
VQWSLPPFKFARDDFWRGIVIGQDGGDAMKGGRQARLIQVVVEVKEFVSKGA